MEEDERERESKREIVRRVTRGPFHASLQMLTTAIFFEHAIFNLERLALRAQEIYLRVTLGGSANHRGYGEGETRASRDGPGKHKDCRRRRVP